MKFKICEHWHFLLSDYHAMKKTGIAESSKRRSPEIIGKKMFWFALLDSFLILFACSATPVLASSAWFQCDSQRIYLNEVKNEFVIEDGAMSYKGIASFFPSSVKFELIWRDWSPSQYGIKYIWQIDRRTLQYTRMDEVNQDTKGFATNKGWVKKNEHVGMCRILKDPYKDKKF